MQRLLNDPLPTSSHVLTMHTVRRRDLLTPLLQPSLSSSTMSVTSEKSDPEVSKAFSDDHSSLRDLVPGAQVPASTFSRYFCRPVWVSRRVHCPRRWRNGQILPGTALSLLSVGVLAIVGTLAVIVAIILGSVLTLLVHQNSNGTTIPLRLAVLANFPDPSLYQAQGTWYMYGTNADAGILDIPAPLIGHMLPQNDQPHVQLATSTDFVTWSIHNNASQPLPRLGAWANQHAPNTTCPNVIQRPSDGKYLMYYSAIDATSAYHVHCTGAGIADSPVGPFTVNDTPLICPATLGGGIDPSAFIEPSNDTLHVVYKINAHQVPGVCLPAAPRQPKSLCNTPIYIQPLDATGLQTAGPPVIILNRTVADGPLVEAPSLVKAGSLYYLFYSAGATKHADYTVQYATSPSLYGPYTRAAHPLLHTGAPFNLEAPGSAAVSRATSTQAAGHAPNFVAGPADDQWRIACAARVRTSYGGVRAVFTASLQFDEQARTVAIVADKQSKTWMQGVSKGAFQGTASYDAVELEALVERRRL